jgi:hypothetical protein
MNLESENYFLKQREVLLMIPPNRNSVEAILHD